MKYNSIVIFAAISCILIREAESIKSPKNCCATNVLVHAGYETCDDGKNITVPCDDGYILVFNPDIFSFSQYIISEDTVGEYLDAYMWQFIIRKPYSHKIHYSELHKHLNNANDDSLLAVYMVFIKYVNAASFLVLGVTALIYYFLPQVQDIQGTCTFHLTLNMGLAHGCFAYKLMTDSSGLLPDLCITNLFLIAFIALCSFAWSCVSSYNMWSEARGRDESKLINRYRIFAYGTPALLIGMASIHAYLAKFYRDQEPEEECYYRQTYMIGFYMALPVVLCNLTNIFFFIDLQKRLWNTSTSTLRGEDSTAKKVRYRFLLNGKLCFIMSLPVTMTLLCYVFDLISPFTIKYFNIGVYLFALITSCEGIFIFAIMVVLRPRVFKGVIQKWFKETTVIPEKWRMIQDSENETESNYQIDQDKELQQKEENDNIGATKMFPEV